MSLRMLPASATIVALALLAWGVASRGARVTVIALAILIAAGVIGIPLLIRADTTAALCGLESAAAVAASVLLVWRGESRYPMFAAVATLLVGMVAAMLLVRACLIPL